MLSKLLQFFRRLFPAQSTPNSSETSEQLRSLPAESPDSSGKEALMLAWGAKVTPTFRKRIYWIAETLGITDPSYLMACIAFESAETFRSDIRNAAGSGATGLIQFMPTTAKSLGYTTSQLAAMTPEDQLNVVYKYFAPYKGRLHTLADVYMAILWPAAVGKPDALVLWSRESHPKTYSQNAGLDINKDGKITKAEAAAKVSAALQKGLQPEFVVVEVRETQA